MPSEYPVDSGHFTLHKHQWFIKFNDGYSLKSSNFESHGVLHLLVHCNLSVGRLKNGMKRSPLCRRANKQSSPTWHMVNFASLLLYLQIQTLVHDIEVISWISIRDLTGDGGVLKKIVKAGLDVLLLDKVTKHWVILTHNGAVIIKRRS